MDKVSVLAITKNGVKMGLSLKKSFPDWQIFAPSKFSDGNNMIKWYDESTSVKIVGRFSNQLIAKNSLNLKWSHHYEPGIG